MGVALIVARLLLTAVFGLAGLAKLFDRMGTRDALRSFHLPARLVPSFAIALPVVELFIGLSILLPGIAWWGALGALAMLLSFIAAISFSLAQGRKPKCRCFGQLHSAPVGRRTLMRNSALAATAGFILSQGPSRVEPSFAMSMNSLSSAHRVPLLPAIFTGLLALLCWALVQILRQQGRLLRRLEILEAQFSHGINSAARTVGLTVGSPAPALELPNLSGEIITLDALRARGLPVVLVFWDPECYPCEALLPQLGRWQRDHADKLTLVPISRGSVESNIYKVQKHALRDVLLQQDHEVDDAYAIDATPTAVLVRQDGRIGSPQAGGADKIDSLVAGLLGLLGPSPLLTAAPLGGNGHASAGISA